MKDPIERQDVIELFSGVYHYMGNWLVQYIENGILSLPSTQSDVPDTNVGDTISRQAAIDALHMHLMYRMGTDSNKKRLDDWINGVPSAQPEQEAIDDENSTHNI